jgi:predicted Zn-ribbon and HTH transcriptional regulator
VYNHPKLFSTRVARTRSERIKQKRIDRKEVVAANDPRILRLAEAKRAIVSLTREARDLTRALKKCRFLPASCKHCHRSWEPTLTPKLRCPECGAFDWLAVPRSYRETALNPPTLDINDHAPDPIDLRPIIDERAAELGLDPPPKIDDDLAMPLAEFREKYVDASPRTSEEEIEAAWDKVNRVHSSPDELVDPLNLPAPAPLKLPGRSPADIQADWDREVAKDRAIVTTTLLEDPLTAPSETDEGADYYLLVRLLTEKGLA